MPRYTATESQLTISPPNRSASANDSAVFPLPVGPSSNTASGSGFPNRVIGGSSSGASVSDAWKPRSLTERYFLFSIPCFLFPVPCSLHLQPPPARRKNPFRIGMKKPPGTNRRRQHHQPDRLVSYKRPPLRRAPFLLGDLLSIRLDACVHHGAQIQPLDKRSCGRPGLLLFRPQYRSWLVLKRKKRGEREPRGRV